MQQLPPYNNSAFYQRATRQSADKKAHLLTLAQRITEDAQKATRLSNQRCSLCHYTPSIGGRAMTKRPCMSCLETQSYTSTATDLLCLVCAKAHGLCRTCGGDIELSTARKDWPQV